MAYQYALLLALFLATTATLARVNGYSINGTTISQVDVLGHVYCTPTGNYMRNVSSPGIEDAEVKLMCNGGKTLVDSSYADELGNFLVLIHTVDFPNFDPLTCYAIVQLSSAGCDLLPNGILRGNLDLSNGVNESGVGVTAYVEISSFQYIP